MSRNSSLAYIFSIAISFIALAGIVFFGVRYFGVAPALTDSFGVNARLQFLKNVRTETPVTSVMGASVAANNIDTDLMRDAGEQSVVNAGSYGLSIRDQQQLYAVWREIQPIRDVIFVSQYYEYGTTQPDRLAMSPSVLKRYLSGDMNLLEEMSYYQFPMLLTYYNTAQLLRQRTTAHSIVHSPTGATKLDMDVRVSDPDHETARLLKTELFCEECMADLRLLCDMVTSDGRDFMAVIGPVQLSAIDDLPQHHAMRADRRARIKNTVQRCGGRTFDAGDFAPFEDACFADYSHLNETGMALFTKMLMDYRADSFTSPTSIVRCE